MMGKILILITFLITSIFSVAQDTPPTGVDFKPLQSVSFKYWTVDSTVWMYKGSLYGWTQLASDTTLKKYYVPYKYAIKDVDLGTFSIAAKTFILAGDILRNTTQISSTDTIIVTKDHLTEVIPITERFNFHNAVGDLGYYEMLLSGADDVLTTFTYTGVANQQILAGWATVTGKPNLDYISEGSHQVFLRARKSNTGSQNVTFTWKLYKKSGVDEVLLKTSGESILLLDNFRICWVASFYNERINLNYNDRLIIKIFANVTGGGVAPNVEVQIEGLSASGYILPTSAAAISNIYVPYTGAKFDVNLGDKNITANNLSGTNTGDQDLTEKANLTEGIAGLNISKYITPETNASVDALRNVPYEGALSNLYMPDRTINADSLTITSLKGTGTRIVSVNTYGKLKDTTIVLTGYKLKADSIIATGYATNYKIGLKQDLITAGTTLQYWRGDKTFQTLNTSIVPELTNLYYTEARVTANTSVTANTAKVTNATHSGDATGATALTLATVNTNVGTFNNVTINAKGLATAGSNVSYEVPLTFSTGLLRTGNTITSTQFTETQIGTSRIATFTEALTGLNDVTSITPLKLVDVVNVIVPRDSINARVVGVINGSNTTFTTYHSFVPYTTNVIVNGVTQELNYHYTESGVNTIVFNAGFIPGTGERIIINYQY